MEYWTVRETAEQWELTERRVTTLCRDGRIRGAVKQGRMWLVPVNAKKPEDGRRSIASVQKHSEELLPLPIGISDFRETVSHYYYVDKTLLIKELLDTRPKVSLFTRPRRFGKTLNMDMLRVFFEDTGEDTSVYFKNCRIWECGKKYTSEQGAYPVIFVSFKDVKPLSWEEALHALKQVIQNEYNRHFSLLESEKLTPYEKEYFRKIMTDTMEAGSWPAALGMLSQMLHKHYGKKPVILIDEYDTPIQQGHLQDYYEPVISFMRSLFSSALKDNPHLSFACLTGILRVAKESIFSGMYNLKVNSILDNRYSEYFGFTKEEVRQMTEYYGKTEKYEEICEWYDGYLFGETEIFNPWSVINYMDEGCCPKAFWQATGNNDIIREMVREATEETKEQLGLLMQGRAVAAYVDTSVIYPEIRNNPSSIYSFLLVAGYLKITGKQNCHDGNYICELAIPNKEIFYVYEKEILSGLAPEISQSTAIAIQQSILRLDIQELNLQLQRFLSETISVFDTGNESFYHGLMLGLYAIMNNHYCVTSNRESGNGQYDIQMLPYNKRLPGILVELKVLRDGESERTIEERLKQLSMEAIKQINTMDYEAEMREHEITEVMKLGIAFYKKRSVISCESR